MSREGSITEISFTRKLSKRCQQVSSSSSSDMADSEVLAGQLTCSQSSSGEALPQAEREHAH